MARGRQHLHVCTIVPLDGPALGVEGRYLSTTRPAIGMLVSVDTRPTPETVQAHEYRVVEILDHRVTNTVTHLRSMHVRSDEPGPYRPPPPYTPHSTPGPIRP